MLVLPRPSEFNTPPQQVHSSLVHTKAHSDDLVEFRSNLNSTTPEPKQPYITVPLPLWQNFVEHSSEPGSKLLGITKLVSA